MAYQVHNLANFQARQGLSPTVFSLSPAPAQAAYRTSRIQVPRWIGHRALRPFLLSWFFRQQPLGNYDVVHVHGDGHLLPHGLPILRTFYGTALHEALSASSPARFLLQLAVYQTELLSTLPARQLCGISRSTCRAIPSCRHVVPCGVDLQQFSPSDARSPTPRLIFVGTLSGRKRGAWLIRQLRKIRRRVPGTELILVGPKSDSGEGWRSLGRIPTDALVAQYRQAWVYVSPSRYEGFGIPLVEAMACATAVVSTPTAGALEILDRGKFGALAHSSLLAARIVDLLRDPAERYRLTGVGHKRAAYYGIERMAARYTRLYESVARSASHSRETSV